MIDVKRPIVIKYIERAARPVHEIVWENGIVAVARVIIDTDLRHVMIDLQSSSVYGKGVADTAYAENTDDR